MALLRFRRRELQPIKHSPGVKKHTVVGGASTCLHAIAQQVSKKKSLKKELRDRRLPLLGRDSL